MKLLGLAGIMLMGVVVAEPRDLLERQIAEQERQIQRLEVENARLRIMLTEVSHHQGDPLYGIEVSKRPGVSGDVPNPAVEVEAPGRVHEVVLGETLSGIALKHAVDLDELAELNALADREMIRPGDRLRLPEATAASGGEEKEADRPRKKPRASPPSGTPRKSPEPPATARGHIVQAGENLYRISLRYGIPLEALLDANRGLDPLKLRVGQRVRVPGQEAPALADRD
jgi:LysM repeat protein